MNFGVPAERRTKRNENERQIICHCRINKDAMNVEDVYNTNLIGALRAIPKVWNKRLEQLEIRETIKTIQTTAVLR